MTASRSDTCEGTQQGQVGSTGRVRFLHSSQKKFDHIDGQPSSQRPLVEYKQLHSAQIGRWKCNSTDVVMGSDRWQLGLGINYALCNRLSENCIFMAVTHGSEQSIQNCAFYVINFGNHYIFILKENKATSHYLEIKCYLVIKHNVEEHHT